MHKILKITQNKLRILLNDTNTSLQYIHPLIKHLFLIHGNEIPSIQWKIIDLVVIKSLNKF